MSVSHAMYQLLIGPLELIFETAYGIAKLVLNNCGLAILVMSLTMNFLLLPLYRRADAIQDEERAIVKKMAPGVAHIKKTFKGDERFMMLQTYYRQHHYKPFYALRGSLPLVLEIPFFIAAYHFLSNLEQLRGMPFGPIADLGAPDGLLTVAGVTIHMLPIVMTLINCVSSAIYTKGYPFKDKLQLYGMALIFLILLYDSPAGLVFYWTLNNLFSLVKNIFCKAKKPLALLCGLLAAAGLVMLVYALGFYHPQNWKNKPFVAGISMLLMLPLPLYLLRGRFRRFFDAVPEKGNTRLFLSGCIFLAVLTGVLIPSAVVASAPAEFVLPADLYSPLRHVLSASLLSFGLFVVWFGIFYYIAGKEGRWVLGLLVWLAAVIAVMDYMFFGTNMGTLSADLKYDTGVAFGSTEKIVNLIAVGVLLVLLPLLYAKKRRIVQGAYLILAVTILGMSAVNLVTIQSAVPAIREAVESLPSTKAQFTLSKKGKNVVVIMLDRAISAYLPYLFQEKPELEKQFAGFTYYPNTLSFGPGTTVGAPGLFGGYEYTPAELNARADEQLVDKHDEALKVLPVLFDENGFDVTVCDPPYAGYRWISDLSIYEDYPDIHTYNTENGEFLDALLSTSEVTEQRNRLWERNFFCFSVMKATPAILQIGVYFHGSYFSPELRTSQEISDLSHAHGQNSRFLESYSVLCSLPEITQISDGDENTLLMLTNSSTHEPALLQAPDYSSAESVDNSAYDAAHADRFEYEGRKMRVTNTNQMTHYHVNMASLLKLGQWLDYLRENDVYDNTRIIIVADHGRTLRQFSDMNDKALGIDLMSCNPLLLVKDFGSTAFSTDESFMTNADVPTLATDELIEDPVNPFTGKRISSEAKQGPQLVLIGTDFRPEFNNGNTFLPGRWYAVSGDVRRSASWSFVGEG